MHLLVRCLDMADRPLQAQRTTSGIRRVLMATGVAESDDKINIKGFLDCTLTMTMPIGGKDASINNRGHGRELQKT